MELFFIAGVLVGVIIGVLVVIQVQRAITQRDWGMVDRGND